MLHVTDHLSSADNPAGRAAMSIDQMTGKPANSLGIGTTSLRLSQKSPWRKDGQSSEESEIGK